MSCPTCGSLIPEARYIVWSRYQYFQNGVLAKGREGSSCQDPFHRVLEPKHIGWPNTLRLSYQDAEFLRDLAVKV